MIKSIFEIAKQIPCEYYNVNIKELDTKSRKGEIVRSRQIAMYFVKKNTKYSLAEIGYNIGRKDHATVLYAIKTINNLIETDKKFALLFDELSEKFDRQIKILNVDVSRLGRIMTRIKEITNKGFWKRSKRLMDSIEIKIYDLELKLNAMADINNYI